MEDITCENVTADTFSGRELVVKNIAISSLVSPFLGAPQVRFSGNSLGSLVRDRLFNEVVRLDRAADARWTACKTRDELSARQTEVRRMAIDAIGGFPERTPLNAQTTGRVRKNGYVVEKVLFESRPGHYVTAHLFLPDDPKFKAPYPGVVSPCGHSLAGKAAPWYQRIGVTGAKMGFATLVYDPVEQGERHQLRDGAGFVGDSPPRPSARSCANLPAADQIFSRCFRSAMATASGRLATPSF